MLSASFNYFSTNDCQLLIFLWTAIEVVTPVKSQCEIARKDEESSLYHNGNLINFTDQISSVFSKQDHFSSFWDQFCRFAYLIRLGDHFCAGITFAAIQAGCSRLSVVIFVIFLLSI